MRRNAPKKITEIVLFNKNRVKVLKHLDYGTDMCCVNTDSSYLSVGGEIPQKSAPKRVRKESPLGFYYNSIDFGSVIKPERLAMRDVTINVNDVSYHVSYIYSVDRGGIYQGGVSAETRPWMLDPDGKSFSDNMAKSLEKVLNDIFSEAANDKRFKSNGEMMAKLQQAKIDIFTDLFNNKNGIRFQTDKEKIESHGFDYKQSFRNRKEESNA